VREIEKRLVAKYTTIIIEKCSNICTTIEKCHKIYLNLKHNMNY
jgi:hypothetical protein